MRYYVYSWEIGFPPDSPIIKTDDINEAIETAQNNSKKYDSAVYVVDVTKNQYQEIYVHIGSRFKEFRELMNLRYAKAYKESKGL